MAQSASKKDNPSPLFSHAGRQQGRRTAGIAQRLGKGNCDLWFYGRDDWRPKFRHEHRLLVAALQTCEKCRLVVRQSDGETVVEKQRLRAFDDVFSSIV